jgi:hypothetical protein
MKSLPIGLTVLAVLVTMTWLDTSAYSAERRGPSDRQRRLDSDVQRADMRQHRLKRVKSLDETGKPNDAWKPTISKPTQSGN